jgi:hypothetical protein
MNIAGFRLAAELPGVVGVLCAAVLAYNDKSAWIWAWFLLFAFCNIISGSASASYTGKDAK